MGGLGGGHYTAYAKNRNTNKWICFDDTSASETSENHIKSSMAYVLFYAKRSTSTSANSNSNNNNSNGTSNNSNDTTNSNGTAPSANGNNHNNNNTNKL